MADTYAKLFFTREAKLRPLILRNIERCIILGHPAVRGIEVNEEGDEVATGGADERLRIIEASLVKREVLLEWNLTYGTLEPASDTGGQR